MTLEQKWDVEKPALMRAYKQTTLKDGDGDAWVERKEFKALIRNIYVTQKLWELFDNLDSGDDRRINLAEFSVGMGTYGVSKSDAKALFTHIDKVSLPHVGVLTCFRMEGGRYCLMSFVPMLPAWLCQM